MHEFLQRDLDSVMRLDEVVWGCALLAITLSIHGAGVFHTIRLSLALIGDMKKRGPGFEVGMLVLVLFKLNHPNAV